MDRNWIERLQEPVIDKSDKSELRYSEEDLETNNDLSSQSSQENSSDFLFITKDILRGAIPTMIQLFTALFVNNATLHFIGQTNDTNLFNGVSLANNVLGCFSFYIIFHTNIGLTAASSQAQGALQFKAVGHYLHRALFIHLIVNAIMYVLLFNSSHVFGLMGIEPAVSQVASDYLVLSPIYTIAIIAFDTLKAFLYAQGIFNPQLFCQMVITVSYWFLTKYFVLQLNMRQEGIMLGLTISHVIGAILLFLYIQFRRPVEVSSSWFFFEKESVQGIWPLFKIMFGVGTMGYVEVLAYKILSFVAIYFTSAQMTTFVTFLAIDDLFYVLPVGIAISLTTSIGNAIGSRDKGRIKRVINITLILSSIFLAFLLGVFLLFRKTIFSFYIQNPEIDALLLKVSHVYAAFLVADFIQNIFGGILKGVGKEKSGTKAFLFSAYLISIPISLVLGFYLKLEAMGMWIGATAGLYCVLASYFYIFKTMDFNQQFNFVAKRIKETEIL